MFKTFLAALFLVLFFSLPAHAAQLADAQAAIDDSNVAFQNAMKHSPPCVSENNTSARCKREWADLFKLMRKAAELGHAEAQMRLGFMYMDGRGVKKNIPEALKWLKKATDQGNSNAAYQLGQMYEQGFKVKKDYAEAYKWNLKAAKLGSVDAMYAFGLNYRDGFNGYKADIVQAYVWFSIALKHDFHDRLLVMYLDELAKEMTSEQLLEAKRLAAQWPEMLLPPVPAIDASKEKPPLEIWREARNHQSEIAAARQAKTEQEIASLLPKAEKGDADAQYKIGVRYKDTTESMKWLRKAADQGHAYAQHQIGYRYFSGEGAKQDYSEAMKWFRKAADQGYEGSQKTLAHLYAHGLGLEKNYEEACFWLAAAKDIDPQACSILYPTITPEQMKAAEKRVKEWRPTPSPVSAAALTKP